MRKKYEQFCDSTWPARLVIHGPAVALLAYFAIGNW